LLSDSQQFHLHFILVGSDRSIEVRRTAWDGGNFVGYVPSGTAFGDHGAVSEETVKEMAENVRREFSADYGIATSGIAGPDGGTPKKPVGTIWIGCADKHGTVTKKLQLTKDRDVNIRLTSVITLHFLYQRMVQKD
jgi:nicotinamide mononucleotide (NMN) deamidase PncC